MDTTENNFMQIRSIVNSIIERHENLRKEIDWKDEGKSATIRRLAKPFQTGYFTIAVAGKMSAGKSTFINSIIGENLLPTGHFQTTSGITWIVSSTKRKLDVTFANGEVESYTEDLPQKLKDLVSVPEKFNSLPINHINNLIKGNDDINEILRKKEGIEEMTKSSSGNDLWREYVEATPKSKIAEKVVIQLPLPKEYEGWRIIDTPGIGAIGGIQDATKQLFTERDEDKTHIVDAVILLHSGAENIEDESANKFANDIKKSMGNLAKDRLFFVLTHASDTKFTDNKKGILSRAENLFQEKLGIDRGRLTYVDSFIHRSYCRLRNSGRDISNLESLDEVPLDWNEKEWEKVDSLLHQISRKLRKEKKETSNSTIFKELEKLSNFSSLQKMLDNFLNNEKMNAFNKLMELIKEDLDSLKKTINEDITIVNEGCNKIEDQIKKLNDEKVSLDNALNNAQQKLSIESLSSTFGFVEEELNKLGKLNSIPEVRTKYLEIIDRGLDEEKKFFANLKLEFKNIKSEINIQSTTYETIDFDEIEFQAKKKATSEVTDYSRPVEELVKRGGVSSNDEYKKTYPYTKKVGDFDKIRREFTALVIKKGREHCTEFKNNIRNQAKGLFYIIRTSYEIKVNETISRLNGYKEDVKNKVKIKEYLYTKIENIENIEREIDNLKKQIQ